MKFNLEITRNDNLPEHPHHEKLMEHFWRYFQETSDIFPNWVRVEVKLNPNGTASTHWVDLMLHPWDEEWSLLPDGSLRVVETFN